MCGFIGRVNNYGFSSQPPPLTSGLKFLGRRGPDSSQAWSSADSVAELLHARLAIVDTDSRAHQPFSDEAHGLTIAFNGEIYNYLELRGSLAEHQFKTHSDTEVVLALYRLQGLAGLQRLRGMFSMSIVDARVRRVYLVRDPIGKKPLFLAQWSHGTYFGSSLLALVAASGQAGQLRANLVDDYWAHAHVSPDQSLLENCTPVQPGEVIELDWEGQVRARHSCVPEAVLEPASERLEEVQEHVDYLLGQSVRRRLSNNPSPVCLLSGGIDSTVVATHLKRQGLGSAITLGSLVPRRNDERYARYAAKRMRMPLQVVRARVRNLADDIAWAMDLQDEPLGIMSFFPLSLMVRSSKEYGKILLTGDGGDEVFLGYGEPADWYSTAAAPASPVKAEPSVTVGGPPPPWMSQWGRHTVGHALLGHMFTKLDRATAEQGVEARCPLLDWDLLMYVRSLKPETLFLQRQAKGLLKAQLGDWPEWFTGRPKMGFTYHLRWAWGGQRFAQLREMISPETVEAFAPFLPPALCTPPSHWRYFDIFRHFGSVWKLLAWSRFTERLKLAATTGKAMETAPYEIPVLLPSPVITA